MPTVFDQSENDCLKYCRHPICNAWTIWIFSRHSTANPAKRIAVESEEIPCPAKMPRRKAGLRAKQGISEWQVASIRIFCFSRFRHQSVEVTLIIFVLNDIDRFFRCQQLV